MQCGCPECGVLLGKVEQGLQSACRCPYCGYECKACLGTNSVLSREELTGSPRMWELALQYGLAEKEKK